MNTAISLLKIHGKDQNHKCGTTTKTVYVNAIAGYNRRSNNPI